MSAAMPALRDVVAFLEQFAPLSLAEEWDNVGLLLGDAAAEIDRAMTCLTITDDVVEEAVTERVGLVVTHHPLPFRPITRITTDDLVGRRIWKLLRQGIAVYSPHTAFDSAAEGINWQWAQRLGLAEVTTLVEPLETPPQPGLLIAGTGRLGELPEATTLRGLAKTVMGFAGAPVKIVGAANRPVRRVAIACGAAGELLPAAVQRGADTLLMGEATFHACLDALASGVTLILTGHYHSERFAVEDLAERIDCEFGGITAWASRVERNPVTFV